ncbi:ArsR/SmtB family transcription factor [Jidongwangia harbinensis]|uniref:ArsR/SmtB family transcription factor n=1 Tax=Jidongwangia harbinensis TaxID=2878561 RepID=UPI001CD93AAF|nr:helix-turn-helix domain-containing protein [Jidongwangia harbinensis]MCA2212868.1 helix-turn-helix domain-containing protein [Jidongwangia harbinensis]
MSLGESRQAALRAMAHPLRLRIMSLLTGAPMTAAEVARELGITHANASYHLRNLLAGGMIVPAGEERIRGGVAKRYRYDGDRDEANERARGPRPDEENQAIFLAVAGELSRRTGHARWSQPKSMADAELWLDPNEWREIRHQVSEAARALHRAARPPRTAGTIRTSTTIAMFEMEPEA